MELRKLQYFISVAEWKNFTIGAEKNYISQSALSKHISEMEYDLGVKLFWRMKSHIQITPEGERLLPIAKEILARNEDFTHQARMLSATNAGSLRIGYSGYWEFPYICNLINVFHKKQPFTNYSFTREHHGKLNYLVHQGQFDVIFTIRSNGERQWGPDVGWKPLLDSPLCVIVSEYHWLASKEYVTLKDLEFETQIIISRDYDYALQPQIDNAFLRAGIMVDFYPSSPINAYDSLLLVLAEKGFVFASRFLANSNFPGLKAIPLKSDIPTLEFGIAFRTDRQKELIQSFLDVTDDIPASQYINNT